MHHLFARLVEKHNPPVNHEIMEGLACTYMKKTEEYIDEVFKSVSKSFPKGLVYAGYERCTPQEEFEEVTRARTNKRSFDLAKSDIYLVKYRFTFLDIHTITRFIYLPFVGEAGIMHLSGSRYHVVPVLSDKVISPGYDEIFVRLLRDKMIFNRCYHSLIIDGVRETTHVIWSRIHRGAKDSKSKSGDNVPATTRANTCIGHYLFAKFGLVKTFEQYVGFTPIIGGNEITSKSYPSEHYVICESTQIKPKSYIGKFYTPNSIKLVIPRSHWNSTSKGLAIAFFYVVDHFPNRFKPDIKHIDDKSLWMILLGHIVYSGAYGENKLYADIEEHFLSLDDYLDTLIVKKLKESGHDIQDFYKLLVLILSSFNELVLDSNNTVNNMFVKSLEVLYYMLEDITHSIFRVNFRLSKLAIKRALTVSDVTETFNRFMKQGSVFKLTSGKIILESVSYSGDNKYPKITSKITEQESLSGKGGTRTAIGLDKHLDISMIEAGSVLFISKANPSPTGRINPFVKMDLATGTILPNPKLTEIRDKTANDLRGITTSDVTVIDNSDIDIED